VTQRKQVAVSRNAPISQKSSREYPTTTTRAAFVATSPVVPRPSSLHQKSPIISDMGEQFTLVKRFKIRGRSKNHWHELANFLLGCLKIRGKSGLICSMRAFFNNCDYPYTVFKTSWNRELAIMLSLFPWEIVNMAKSGVI
jgi:hypothetical protein